MVLRKITIMKSSLPLNWELFKSTHPESEKNISGRPGSYKNLSAEALYTSVEDLREIFKHPLINGKFLDLGCGQGMAPLLYGNLFPDRASAGIEFESERLKVGELFRKEHDLENVSLIHADLLTTSIPRADTYFLYFPTGPVLDRLLTELYKRNHSFTLIAIESHGDLLPRLDLENWLTQKGEIPLKSCRHHPSARIYQRNFSQRPDTSLPFTLSYQNYHLLIEEGGDLWLGDTFGMEWTEGDRFELLTPPRTIFWKNVKKMMVFSELDKRLQLLTALRTKGEVTVATANAEYPGFIRKIVVSPTFRLEISSGQQVEWEKILTITQGHFQCYESSSDF